MITRLHYECPEILVKSIRHDTLSFYSALHYRVIYQREMKQ